MNVYGKGVLEALTEPRTLEEIAAITGYSIRYVFAGILDARLDGHKIVAENRPGERTTYRREVAV